MKFVKFKEFNAGRIGVGSEIYVNPDHIVSMREQQTTPYEGMNAVTYTEITCTEGITIKVGSTLIETSCLIEAFTEPSKPSKVSSLAGDYGSENFEVAG